MEKAFLESRRLERTAKKEENREKMIRVFELSARELFQWTLTAHDFSVLGVQRKNLVALMIFGEILLRNGRTMDIAHLRHFECTEEEIEKEEIEGFFLNRGKFLEIIDGFEDGIKKSVIKHLKGQHVIRVTKKLLEIAQLKITRATEFVGTSSLMKKLSLKDEDLIRLGLPEKARMHFDEKIVTIKLLASQDAGKCRRATFCNFQKRCDQIAENNLNGGFQYASCDQCKLFSLDLKRAKEQVLVGESSFGISSYDNSIDAELRAIR